MKAPPSSVQVWGAAKVNVGWRVGERRPDGYHEVCGNIQTISLTDRLEITVDDHGDVPVRVSVPGHQSLEDPSNLVCKAAAVLAERADTKPTRIVVHKAIPVAAGLGGGSADAGAALVGLNTVWQAGRTARELVSLGAEVGSDVPAILLGGLVHASGRGERVRSLGSSDGGFFVLGVGSETIASKDAYASLERGEGKALYNNDLEAAACSLVPELGPRLDAMRRAAGVAFVTGSGPTVVGVTSDEAHARDVVARVRNMFADVIVAQPISWGVRLKVGP